MLLCPSSPGVATLVFLLQVGAAPEKVVKEERLVVHFPHRPPFWALSLIRVFTWAPAPNASLTLCPRENYALPVDWRKEKFWNKISEVECSHSSFEVLAQAIIILLSPNSNRLGVDLNSRDEDGFTAALAGKGKFSWMKVPNRPVPLIFPSTLSLNTH